MEPSSQSPFPSLVEKAMLPALDAESKRLAKSLQSGELPAIAQSMERVSNLLNMLVQNQTQLTPNLKDKIVHLKIFFQNAGDQNHAQSLLLLQNLSAEVLKELSDRELSQLQPIQLILKMALKTLDNRFSEAYLIAQHVISNRLDQEGLDPADMNSLIGAVEFFKKSLREQNNIDSSLLLMRLSSLEVDRISSILTKISDNQTKGFNWAA